MAKTLTRAEMKRAAQALMMALYSVPSKCYRKAADAFAISVNEINASSSRYSWAIDKGWLLDEDVEASMLMSEAYRPAGHDGDGKDD